MSWWPDRKWFAGGLAGILTWAIVSALRQWAGLEVDPAAVSGAIGFVIAYLVPPSVHDIVKRVDNTIVRLATADPLNSTTAIVVPASVAASPQARDAAVSAGMAAAPRFRPPEKPQP